MKYKALIKFLIVILTIIAYAADAPNINANENTSNTISLGLTIPNIKTTDSIGLAIDDGDFNFFSHGDDGDLIFNSPAISLTHAGKFDFSFIFGSHNKNYNFQTSNEGDYDFLDLIPVDGSASPGEIINDEGLKTIVTKSNLNMLSYSHLWDASDLNLNKDDFLHQLRSQFLTKVGFKANYSQYSTKWDYTFYDSKDSISVFSVGPTLRLEAYAEPLNENTDIYYKADISALLSRDSMDAVNSYGNNSIIYKASDDRIAMAGIVNLVVGMNNQHESGAVISLTGALDIRNDLPFIAKPICTTGMDCDSADYAAQAKAAHLDTRITVSPSINLSVSLDF